MPASPNEMRVAVLGVPRGGTSMVANLLRIAGFRLPADDPVCPLGESRAYRPDAGRNLKQLAARVETLPLGTVWKDPQVARYVDQIDWRTWKTVRVVREPVAVGDSEMRWSGQSASAMAKRAVEWNTKLGAALPDVDLILYEHEVRNTPGSRTLAILNLFLGLYDSTPEQIAQARAYVQPSSGYRCPLPGECDLCPRS